MNKNGDYTNLEHLSVKEVLSENPIDKIITLLATDKDENKVCNIHCHKNLQLPKHSLHKTIQAVVLISKKPFESEDGQKLLNKADLKLDLKNDIYHTFGTVRKEIHYH